MNNNFCDPRLLVPLKEFCDKIKNDWSCGYYWGVFLPYVMEKYKESAVKIFFIGREVDYAVAREGSLKLKEISYIHSEANAAGELKHGPIALIEKGVPVIGIATNDEINSKTFSNIEEVIARGADSILITNTEKAIPEIINNNQVIKIANISPMISAIISIIPMQLFAYYIAKEKGLDVDKPRNLAKSVTVE